MNVSDALKFLYVYLKSTTKSITILIPVSLFISLQPSGWRKLRNIVQWTPFFQTYKKQRYPWVQLAGHQGNFKAGPDPGTVLKKMCPKEEKCFRVSLKKLKKAVSFRSNLIELNSRC